MRPGWLSWPLGLGLSALVNAGALAGLAVILRPEPVPDRPRPDTELEVIAYRLDRTRAQPAAPDPDRAAESAADPAALDPGAVPVAAGTAVSAAPDPAAALAPAPSRVPSRPAPADALTGTAPPVAPVAAGAAQGIDTAPADPEVATARSGVPPASAATPVVAAPRDLSAAAVERKTAPATPAPAIGLAAARARPQGLDPARPAVPVTADAARPDSLPLAPVRLATLPAGAASPAAAPARPADPAVTRTAPSRDRPATTAATTARPVPAPPARPDARPAPVGQPSPDPIAPGAPAARPLPRATPNPTRMQAALAFAGGDSDGDIDPVSLAAFQSFVAPGEATADDTLRDGLAGLLSAVPCSRLQIAFDPDTASLRVDGHIPEDDLRDGILGALRAEMGADIPVSDNMALLPRPQCGALSGIGQVGLPQSTDQATNPLLLGDTLQARALDFSEGELLYFDLVAPDYDAHVYVDYFDAEGNVLHLSPNESAPLIRAAAGTRFRVGAAAPGDPGLKLFVGPPYGQEIAVAFAASSPLHDGSRPIVEPAAPYLDWLKTRVSAARTADPQFRGEWVYFFVTTRPG